MKKASKEEILKSIEINNYKLLSLLKQLKINKINLINCGNSIASGYSLSSFTKPLLLRNETIQKIAEEKGLVLKRYNFSRPEDNNDEHIFDWLVNDVPLSVINKLNRFDIEAMHEIGVDDEKADEYYPLDDETALNKLLKDDTSSNIIIYNGATGSFLDNVTRKGKHYFTYGIKRDCTSIESFLKYVQSVNREQNKNIQVFLCGAPKLMGFTDLPVSINPRLKSISKNYANVSYVDNIDRKLLYKKDKNKFTLDMHYDEYEYLVLNNEIVKKIGEQYLINNIMIEIDRSLFLINKLFQLGELNRNELSTKANETIDMILSKHDRIIKEQNIDVQLLYKKIKEYLLSRSPYDFYYIGKNTIKERFK